MMALDRGRTVGEHHILSLAPAPPGNMAPCGFNICGLNLQPQRAEVEWKVSLLAKAFARD